MNLTGKVALITGSGRGIGKAIALKLSELGAAIVINDMSEAAEAVVDEIKAKGGSSIFIKANVTSSEEVNEMVKTILKEYGKIDILVNNAGITRDQLSMLMSDDDWDAVLDVNLKGTFICSRAVLRPMMKQRAGRIINISSIVGIVGNAGQPNYCASKAGIIGLTKSIAREMGSRHVTVNAIAPGFIESDMTDKLPDKVKEEYVKRIPLGYFGTPKDVAEAVAFLASDEARYISGQVLNVDGGM